MLTCALTLFHKFAKKEKSLSPRILLFCRAYVGQTYPNAEPRKTVADIGFASSLYLISKIMPLFRSAVSYASFRSCAKSSTLSWAHNMQSCCTSCNIMQERSAGRWHGIGQFMWKIDKERESEREERGRKRKARKRKGRGETHLGIKDSTSILHKLRIDEKWILLFRISLKVLGYLARRIYESKISIPQKFGETGVYKHGSVVVTKSAITNTISLSKESRCKREGDYNTSRVYFNFM